MACDDFVVWRKQTAERGQTAWIRTARTIKARTDREAQTRLRRTFARAGFSAMALVAVRPGHDPNDARVFTART